MIVKDYIKKFESYGFGMFVHFGLYSVVGRGEWAYHMCKIPNEEYGEVFKKSFNPDKGWARELAKTAKAAGCRYITLTVRHHDGFSLFDAKGLTDYDAPHSAAGRDLIREFVDACREYGLAPFFYHTLLDWHEPSYKENFSRYLEYLRASIEILCTEYGEVGGFWFDGYWDKKDADWEFDKLYKLIRKHQPRAMIINNTGLSARGEVSDPEIDSVTFERGRPGPINAEGATKYVASEMCQIFGDHWGYARLDFNFKSLAEIIKDYCTCRRYRSNFLLNVGPMGNGLLRPLDTALLTTLGAWIDSFSEALIATEPSGIEVSGGSFAFILKSESAHYLFTTAGGVRGDANVVLGEDSVESALSFNFPGKIKSMHWLDNGCEVDFSLTDGGVVTVNPTPQPYGQSVVVRIAKIEA